MNQYLITYDENKTVTVQHATADLAKATLKKVMPNIKIKSSIKLPKSKYLTSKPIKNES